MSSTKVASLGVHSSCEWTNWSRPATRTTCLGLSWDALLKHTGVELELLTNIDMHLFTEMGLRNGISMVSQLFANANNPWCQNLIQASRRPGSSTMTSTTCMAEPCSKRFQQVALSGLIQTPLVKPCKSLQTQRRVHTRTGRREPRRAARGAQRVPAGARTCEGRRHVDVGLPAWTTARDVWCASH